MINKSDHLIFANTNGMHTTLGISMPTIERVEIAATAHAGQRDKAGQPYIFHPLRVMLRVDGAHEQMAAVCMMS